MTDKQLAQKKRAQAIAKQDIAIWDALIGAAGQPNVQKFIIMSRVYNLTRAALNISHPELDREEQILHKCMNSDSANSVHNFIKFVDGRIDVEQARAHQNALSEIFAAA